MQATPGRDDRARELAWITEHHYRMLHTSFCVRADDAIAEEIDTLLAPFRLPAPLSRPRRHYALVAADAAQADSTVLAYPKPLMLSPRSRSLLGLRAPAGFLREADDEALVVAGDLGARLADGPLSLTDVVQLARGAGPPRLHPLPRSQVVALLLGTSFNHYKRPLDAFDLVTRLARHSRAWRLEYGDPALAARLLAEQLAPAVSRTFQ